MKRILFQGDSITDGSRNREDFYSTGGGYPKLVKAALGVEHLGEYEFINRGVLGDGVQELYGRRREDLLALAPDYLSVYVGVNDVWAHVDGYGGTDTPTFERVYGALLDEFMQAFPRAKCLLLAPFVLKGSATEDSAAMPRRWEQFSRGVAQKAAAVKAIGGARGIPVIDLQGAFDEACLRMEASYWTWDGVHPTAYGHEIIKRLWIKAFDGLRKE